MHARKNPDQKEEQLRRHGVLNPKPEKVRDELFNTTSFFDSRDLAQVRYEMLRRHRVDKIPVSKTVDRFGVSRPTFYQTAKTYEREGIPGLVPRKPGPKGPRRCTPEIVQFAQKRQAESPGLTMEEILQEVSSRFGRTIHRRTLERGLAKARKRGRRASNPRVQGSSQKRRT